MPDITAQDVKALRDATGAGMMDAKKALTDEQVIDIRLGREKRR